MKSYRIHRPGTTPRRRARTDERLLIGILASGIAYLVYLLAIGNLLLGAR